MLKFYHTLNTVATCGQKSQLSSNKDLMNTIRLNGTIASNFLIDYLISFLLITRLIEFRLAILWLLIYNDYGYFLISITTFLSCSGTDSIKEHHNK